MKNRTLSVLSFGIVLALLGTSAHAEGIVPPSESQGNTFLDFKAPDASLKSGSQSVSIDSFFQQSKRKTSPPPSNPTPLPPPIPEIEVVLGYSADYVQVMGGHAQAINRIQQLVTIANDAYASSGAPIRIKAVSIIPVDFSNEQPNRDALPQLVYSLETTAGNASHRLARERLMTGADMIGLIRPFKTDKSVGCDSGYLPAANNGDLFRHGRTAVFAFHDGGDRACHETTMAHVIGHLLGLEHNQERALNFPISAHKPYGHGVRKQGVGGQWFVDIMGVREADTDTRISLFASPDLTCLGVPCGDATTANAVRAINDAVPAVETWGRPSGGIRYTPDAKGTLGIQFDLGNVAAPAGQATVTQWAPVVTSFVDGPRQDPTPLDPFDLGSQLSIRYLDLPSNPSSAPMLVEVEALTESFVTGDFRILAGTGALSLANARCDEAFSGTALSCRFQVQLPAGAAASQAWIVVQRRNALNNQPFGYKIIAEDSVLPLTEDTQASLTAPKTWRAGLNRFEWHFELPETQFTRSQRYKAAYWVKDGNGNTLRTDRVTLERWGVMHRPVILSEVEQQFVLVAGHTHRQIGVPVSAGDLGKTLTIHLDAPSAIDAAKMTAPTLHLPLNPQAGLPALRGPLPPVRASEQGAQFGVAQRTSSGWTISFTPNQTGLWTLSTSQPSGNGNVDFSLRGRLSSSGTSTNALTWPSLKWGHFYNPSRSGHGFFFEPSPSSNGPDQWVLIWYTYDLLGRPKWYYAQNTAAAFGERWAAPIYEATWNAAENRNALRVIGRTEVGFDGPEALTFTYWLNGGEQGSETVRKLGAGRCLATASGNENLSGLYFSPSAPGYGYSVQFEQGLELIIGFIYDNNGNPTWAYSQSGVNGQTASLTAGVAQNGFCPTCEFRPNQLDLTVNPAGVTDRTKMGQGPTAQLTTLNMVIDYRDERGVWAPPPRPVERLGRGIPCD